MDVCFRALINGFATHQQMALYVIYIIYKVTKKWVSCICIYIYLTILFFILFTMLFKILFEKKIPSTSFATESKVQFAIVSNNGSSTF